jgi:hypothetical protein
VAQSTKPQRFFSSRGRFQTNKSFRDQPFRDQSFQRSSFIRPQHNNSFRKNQNNNKPYIGQNEETTQNAADYQLPTLKDIKPTDNLVAGRIKHLYSNWTLIKSNPWILSIVQGYKIPFVRQPIQWRQRQTKTKSKEDSIKESILQLQAKGAVKAVQDETNQFTSTLFIVKQVSKDRQIFILKNLNHFVQSQKFKMEGLEAVGKLIQPGDFMMKLDLQDA